VCVPGNLCLTLVYRAVSYHCIEYGLQVNSWLDLLVLTYVKHRNAGEGYALSEVYESVYMCIEAITYIHGCMDHNLSAR
jgi:hypothetical protein